MYFPSSLVMVPLAMMLSVAFKSASGQKEIASPLASAIFPSSLLCA
jgi:hypothetical protein